TDSPRGPKSPKQSTGRASVLSPRTNVLICVLMDSHIRPSCVDGHRRTHTDTHGQPQTSCVCWRTPTDVLCVLTRQPTWAKITRTVHKKVQRAESKDQRADMCTDGQPRTSCVPRAPKSPKQSTGRVSVLSPRTNVLICVLMDSHGRPVCADGHTRTHTDSHGRPVCAGGHPQTSCPTWAKITQTVHGKGQRAGSKDQRADMCTDGQPRTSCVCIRTHTDSHGRPVYADKHTDVLCVLTDTHGQPVCADRHTQTHMDVLCVLTDSHKQPRMSCVTNVLICVLMDSHGHHVCADGHTRTHTHSHERPMHSPHGPKSPEQSTGRVSVLSPRTNVLICVLMDSHRRPVCADGHTRTHKDSHGRPVCAGGHPRTSYSPRGPKSPKQSTGRASVQSPRTNVLICVLMGSHEHPVCADGHTRTATDVLCMLTDTHGRPVCADGHPWTSCVC
ncbi:unnamed protein product, partial [Brassica rapa]